MITVFGSPQSRSMRVTWLLEELGVEYDYHLVDFSTAGHRAPEYLAINPAGKVPAIRDGDLVLLESGAILTYLADKYSEKGLIPAVGTPDRGLFEQWSYFAVCELEQPLWTMGKHKFALPAEKRCRDVLPTAAWEFQKAVQLLSEGLGDREYILGATLSAVDILLAQTLIWGMFFKQPVEQANLKAYVKRMQSRPAMLRALQREADEKKKQASAS
jgi:glutathione S-transferase